MFLSWPWRYGPLFIWLPAPHVVSVWRSLKKKNTFKKIHRDSKRVQLSSSDSILSSISCGFPLKFAFFFLFWSSSSIGLLTNIVDWYPPHLQSHFIPLQLQSLTAPPPDIPSFYEATMSYTTSPQGNSVGSRPSWQDQLQGKPLECVDKQQHPQLPPKWQ